MRYGYTNKKKLLSALVAAQFAMSAFSPLAFAEGAPEPAPFNPTETQDDKDVKANIEGIIGTSQDLNQAFKDRQDADTEDSSNSAIGQANEKQKEKSQKKKQATEEKAQQVNGTSSSKETVYNCVRSDGSFVTVSKNKCWQSTEDACQVLVYHQVKNADGNYVYAQEPSNMIEYTTSDGKDPDATVLQSIELQKQQAQILSNAGSPSEYASSIVTASALSLQNTNLPTVHKIALMAIAYQQAMNDAQADLRENQAKKAEEDAEKARTNEEAENTKKAAEKTARLQKEMNILKVDDADGTSSFDTTKLFTVSISPAIPVNTDNTDISLTLAPKNDAAKKILEAGQMTATVRDPKSGKKDTIPVTEQVLNGWPIIVEFGHNVEERPDGQRTVILTYTPDAGGAPKTYTIRYDVKAYVNSLNDQGKIVSASVITAYANANLARETGGTLSVSGKIGAARWDNDKNVCVLSLSDTTSIMDLAATVETSQATQHECESSIGNYAVFKSVIVQDKDERSIYFRDVGEAKDSDISMSLTAFREYEDADAANVQRRTSGTKDYHGHDYEKVLRADPNTGDLVLALAGDLGVNFTMLPNGQMVSVHKKDDGTYEIGKPNGEAYDLQELARISNRVGYDLSPDKVTVELDDNGLTVIKDKDGNVISHNEFDESNYASSRIGSSWIQQALDSSKYAFEKGAQIASGLTGSATA